MATDITPAAVIYEPAIKAFISNPVVDVSKYIAETGSANETYLKGIIPALKYNRTGSVVAPQTARYEMSAFFICEEIIHVQTGIRHMCNRVPVFLLRVYFAKRQRESLNLL